MSRLTPACNAHSATSRVASISYFWYSAQVFTWARARCTTQSTPSMAPSRASRSSRLPVWQSDLCAQLLGKAGRAAHQHAHAAASRNQLPQQFFADEARAAQHENVGLRAGACQTGLGPRRNRLCRQIRPLPNLLAHANDARAKLPGNPLVEPFRTAVRCTVKRIHRHARCSLRTACRAFQDPASTARTLPASGAPAPSGTSPGWQRSRNSQSPDRRAGSVRARMYCARCPPWPRPSEPRT